MDQKKFEESKKKYREQFQKLEDGRRKTKRIEENEKEILKGKRLKICNNTPSKITKKYKQKENSNNNATTKTTKNNLTNKITTPLNSNNVIQNTTAFNNNITTNSTTYSNNNINTKPIAKTITTTLNKNITTNAKTYNSNNTTTKPITSLAIATTTTNLSNNNSTTKSTGNNTNTTVTTKEQEEPVLKYPPGPKHYQLYNKDLQRISNGEYLNDLIIDCALKWVELTYVAGDWANLINIVNSIWFNRVTRNKTYGENLEATKTWFPEGHPFGRPVVLIPVCQNNHWYSLVAICANDTWECMVLDSLNLAMGYHARDELVEIIKRCHPNKRISTRQAPVVLQKNSVDCGIHVLHNITKLAAWIIQHPKETLEKALEQLLREPCPIPRHIWTTIFRSLARGTPVRSEMLREWLETTTLEEDLMISEDEEEEEGSTMCILPGQEVEIQTGIIVQNKMTQGIQIKDGVKQQLIHEFTTAKNNWRNKAQRRLNFKRETEVGQVHFRIARTGKGRISII